MINKVTLMGNLGKNPEVWKTQEGQEITSFPLATTTTWKDKEGEWQSATDWHQVTVFRHSTVQWVKDLLKKGDKVYVEGKLSYNRWTDSYNQERLKAQIVVTGHHGCVQHIRSSQASSPENGSEKTEISSPNPKSEPSSSNTQAKEQHHEV